MSGPPADWNGIRERLESRRAEWEDRLRRIRADRRRESDPLEGDWHERATQRENDETLDALDVAGRRELREIDAALERLDTGTYGRCVRCQQPIEPARLEALPTATSCLRCIGGPPERSGRDA